jgi:hypothetical protein
MYIAVMEHLQAFHDWLLKTVSGILLIGVVGSLLAAGFLKGTSWCVRKALVVFPPRLRHLNRKKTERAITRLQRLHDNPSAIILEVVFSLGYVSTGFCLAAVVFAFLALASHPSEIPANKLAIHAGDAADMLTAQVVLAGALLAGYFGVAMFTLYYRVVNYERVMSKLRSHLKEFDL